MLRFVGDQAGEIDAGEKFAIARQRSVRGDDERVRRKIFGAGETLLAVVNKHAQLRRETRGFTAPVFHERSRTNDERRTGRALAVK